MKPTEETEIADKKFNWRRAVGAGLWTSFAGGLVLGVGFLAFAVAGLLIIGYAILGGAAPDDAFSFMTVPVVTAIAVICVVWIAGLPLFKFSRSTAIGVVAGLLIPVLSVVGGFFFFNDGGMLDKIQRHKQITEFFNAHGIVSDIRNGVPDRGFSGFTGLDTGYFSVEAGVKTYYFEDGSKRREMNPRTRVETSWYPDGQKESEINRIAHSCEILSRYCNELGRFDGLVTEWYENGEKRNEQYYVNGEQQGLETSWHENGQKSHEKNFDGNLEGLETYWHDNGQKRYEETSFDGEGGRRITEWRRNGQKLFEANFIVVNGLLREKVFTNWHENGQKSVEVSWVEGVRSERRWDENGDRL